MPTINDICDYLERFAPSQLAEDWDNVGLLTGDRTRPVERIMTCLTVTPESAAEAIDERVDLIVAHHPLPFRPMKRITTDQVATKMLWDLMGAGISIYSPHTSFDSAANGINFQLAKRLGLQNPQPLKTEPDMPPGLGAGRHGPLESQQTISQIAQSLKSMFGLPTVQIVGTADQPISRVAVACGSGGSFLSDACRAGCDLLVTGETNFHTALEAKASGIGLVLLGHYSSERFAVETLADQLKQEFPGVTVWSSQRETDPLSWI